MAAAALRVETRGSHWREDAPAADDAWLGHLVTTLDAEGALHTRFEPAEAS